MSKMFEPLNNKETAMPSKDGIAITPVPDDVKVVNPNHYSLGTPSYSWEYRNENGQLLMLVCRFIGSDGKKEDRPLTYRQYPDGKSKWAWKSLDAPRPLYGLDRLANNPKEIVLICEGEKSADAAQKIFPDYVAVTTPNGAGSPRMADLSPLHGRIVIIWPDNDEDGIKYAKSLESLLKKEGVDGALIVSTPDDFPEKWDLADPLPDGVTQEDLQKMLDDAESSPNLLDDLIQKCTTDKGYAYQDEVIDALNDLRFDDKPEYMRLRAELKKLGIGITELEKDMYNSRVDAGLEDGDPDHLQIARDVLSYLGLENLISDKADVWIWQESGVWASQPDRSLKQKIQRFMDRETSLDISKSLVDCVVDVLKNEVYAESHIWNIDQNSINVLNGELILEGGQWALQEHYRESYRTTQIPVEYDPDVSCPRFSRFMAEIFAGDSDGCDKAQAVLEMIGYTLVNSANREKFALLIGCGANGKSVILEVIRSLLGSDNVAAVQPSQLSNRFQRAHLHMKMANLVTEIPEGGQIADAELKAITSGELMTAEHKNQNPFDFAPFCTCWFGSNHLPHTRDFSEALFRRALVVPFNRVFKEGVDADPNLKNELKKELPGILNLCLAAYSKVIQSNRFTEPQSCIDAKEEWRMDANQVAQFVEQKCVMDTDSQILSSELYNAYKSWADNEAGISHKLNHKNFTNRLSLLGGKPHKGTRGMRYIKGVRLLSY